MWRPRQDQDLLLAGDVYGYLSSEAHGKLIKIINIYEGKKSRNGEEKSAKKYWKKSGGTPEGRNLIRTTSKHPYEC